MNDRGPSRLSDAAIEGLRPSSSILSFSEGEAVVRKGETGTAFYVVVSGEVEIRLQSEDGRTLPLSRLGPGATFGEMALLRDEAVSADVVAVRPATLMECPAESFNKALAECEPLRTELMARLADDLHNTTSEAWDFFQKADALRLLIRCENRNEPLIQESAKMRAVARTLSRLADGRGPVLVLGKPGTGKLFAARTLHSLAHRVDAPLIIVDCHKVRRSDAAKLLFGTSDENESAACRTRPGAIQLARGGTLILRHIEALESELQERLAAVSRADRSSSGVFLIATMRHEGRTSTSLTSLHASLVAAFGKSSIIMPPLCDRRRDIRPLADFFLKEIDPTGAYFFSVDAGRALATLEYNHHNASQLRETVEVAILCADGSEIRAEHLFSRASNEEGASGLDLRRLLRQSRLFRGGSLSLIRAIVLVSFFGVIITCLTAGSTPPGRLANLFIWGIWEPVVFGLFLLAGSVWCTVCPLSTAGRFGQKFASLRLAPPPWLKRSGAWIGAIGFFAIIAFEIVFHMEQNPRASGLLLSGLVLASITFCTVYSREVWCRYVCPLGALASGLAPAAPLEVSARPGLCSSSCTTHNCYKGSSSAAGCSVFHHPLNTAESHQCKLCFDCFKTCPHESTRILLRPPVVGVWRLSAASAGLAPFAVVVFILTLVLLAAKNNPRLAEPTVLAVAGLGAIAVGALFHRFLPYLLLLSSSEDVESQTYPGVAVQVAFALLVLGWGPLMAYQIANVPTIEGLRFGAVSGSFWAQVLPTGGLSLAVLIQVLSIAFAAGLTVIALGGIVFLARRRGTGLSLVGWSTLSLLCMLYVGAALYVLY